MTTIPHQVAHVSSKQRFELRGDAGVAWIDYIRAGTSFVIAHTEVPLALEGQGIGAALVRAAMAHAEAEGLTVIPVCPFAVAYLRRHPEYDHLLVGRSSA